MKFKTGDQVIIIAGKDKGKKGKILRTLHKKNKIVVEKVNLKTKYVKKTAQRAGEKIQFEAGIDASNAMLICPDTGKRTRIGYRISESGKKERYSKKSGQLLAKVTTK